MVVAMLLVSDSGSVLVSPRRESGKHWCFGSSCLGEFDSGINKNKKLVDTPAPAEV